MENKPDLPPVKELFKQAWETLKVGIKPLFFLYLFVIVIYLFAGLIVGAVSLLIGFSAGVFSGGFNPGRLFDNPLLLIFGFLILVTILLLAVLVGSLMPVGAVLILDQPSSPKGLKDTLRRSFRLLVPLSFSLLLGGILAFGGFFVFILPAIIFQFLFLFTTYEVVLGGRRYGAALRRSYFLVSHHFKAVFLRLLAFWLLYFVVDVFIPNILRRVEPRTGDIVSFILNVGLSWYGISYMLTLYKHIRASSEPDKEKRLFWLVVTSLMGWVIFAALSVWAVQFIASGAAARVIEELQRNLVTPTPTPFLPTGI